MDRIETMQTFVRVAELGSFTRAADHLGIPKASVSTAVRLLEERMNARLMHRTTRRVELTADGALFLAHCRDVLAEFEELDSMFNQSATALKGKIRLDCSQGAARQILRHLPEFLDRHPQLEIDICSNDHRVDLIREGIDCVIRAGFSIDEHLIARPVGKIVLANFASAEYVKRYGQPQSIDDLKNHRLINYGVSSGSKPFEFEYFENGESHSVKMPGSLSVNNSDAYTAACLAGMGIIQTALIGGQEHLDSGRLVEILPSYRAEPIAVSLVYIHRRHQPLRLRVFMDWLVETIKRYYA